MTSGAPSRFVDSHVHHWHLPANPWYPAIQSAEAEFAALLASAARGRMSSITGTYRWL
jgi:hypothetical protein